MKYRDLMLTILDDLAAMQGQYSESDAKALYHRVSQEPRVMEAVTKCHLMLNAIAVWTAMIDHVTAEDLEIVSQFWLRHNRSKGTTAQSSIRLLAAREAMEIWIEFLRQEEVLTR